MSTEGTVISGDAFPSTYGLFFVQVIFIVSLSRGLAMVGFRIPHWDDVTTPLLVLEM
jgi:hypothetical protein